MKHTAFHQRLITAGYQSDAPRSAQFCRQKGKQTTLSQGSQGRIKRGQYNQNSSQAKTIPMRAEVRHRTVGMRQRRLDTA